MPLIIETSPGRYHVKFYFKSPVPISKKGFIKAVQRALYQAFKDMGADPVVTEDLTRFLRNENQENCVNKKYPDKPSVVIREKGQLCTLSELYKVLKQSGFIQCKGQGLAKPRRARQIPFHVSQHRILAFLHNNPGIITTYKELFRACNVSESTGYLLLSGLRKAGRITIETVRVGRTWKTRFTLIVDTLRKESSTLALGDVGIKKKFADVVRRVSRVGFPVGLRNESVFIISLGLKKCGFEENGALALLDPGFSLSQYAGDHRFSERELRKTVRSAFKEKYRYCVSFKSPKWCNFLNAITNLECQKLRGLEADQGGEIWQDQRM